MNTTNSSTPFTPLLIVLSLLSLQCMMCSLASINMSRTKFSQPKSAGWLAFAPRSTTWQSIVAWEHIHLLTSGNTAHHEKSVIMAMKMPDGKVAINRKENMSIFTPHPTLREKCSTTITPSTLPSLMRLPNVPCSPSLTHPSPSTRLMLPSAS